MSYSSLYNKAKEAADLAYSPYSGFKVGAAVLCDNSLVYTGCNIENASYSATCCAERVALFNAITHGQKHFKAIAIYGSNDIPCYPCGMCLQVISELAPEADIVLGESLIYTLKQLLPKGFNGSFLKEKGGTKDE